MPVLRFLSLSLSFTSSSVFRESFLILGPAFVLEPLHYTDAGRPFNPLAQRSAPHILASTAAIMVNKILITFLVFNVLFLCTGGLILAVCFIFKDDMNMSTMRTDLAVQLLLQEAPLTGEPALYPFIRLDVEATCSNDSGEG